MGGLKKKKSTAYVQAKAVPTSLQIVGVLTTFLDSPRIADGFTNGCRGLTSYIRLPSTGCSVSTILTLKWGDISLRQFRANVGSPNEVIKFGAFTLFNRKPEVAEGHSFNLNIFQMKKHRSTPKSTCAVGWSLV
jgi:hypothetical protein